MKESIEENLNQLIEATSKVSQLVRLALRKEDQAITTHILSITQGHEDRLRDLIQDSIQYCDAGFHTEASENVVTVLTNLISQLCSLRKVYLQNNAFNYSDNRDRVLTRIKGLTNEFKQARNKHKDIKILSPPVWMGESERGLFASQQKLVEDKKFIDLLNAIGALIKEQHCPFPTIFISYAWPSDIYLIKHENEDNINACINSLKRDTYIIIQSSSKLIYFNYQDKKAYGETILPEWNLLDQPTIQRLRYGESVKLSYADLAIIAKHCSIGPNEFWVQRYLQDFCAHLSHVGIVTYLDLNNSKCGYAGLEHMARTKKVTHMVIYGTPSLSKKDLERSKMVHVELNNARFIRQDPDLSRRIKIIPILLIGTFELSFPPDFPRYMVIDDARSTDLLYDARTERYLEHMQSFLDQVIQFSDKQSCVEKWDDFKKGHSEQDGNCNSVPLPPLWEASKKEVRLPEVKPISDKQASSSSAISPNNVVNKGIMTYGQGSQIQIGNMMNIEGDAHFHLPTPQASVRSRGFMPPPSAHHKDMNSNNDTFPDNSQNCGKGML